MYSKSGDEPVLLTAQQLHYKLGISVDSIYKLGKQGKIPEVRFAKRARRYILEDVIAALRVKSEFDEKE